VLCSRARHRELAWMGSAHQPAFPGHSGEFSPPTITSRREEARSGRDRGSHRCTEHPEKALRRASRCTGEQKTGRDPPDRRAEDAGHTSTGGLDLLLFKTCWRHALRRSGFPGPRSRRREGDVTEPGSDPTSELLPSFRRAARDVHRARRDSPRIRHSGARPPERARAGLDGPKPGHRLSNPSFRLDQRVDWVERRAG
jgi:hypothetical protein